MIFFLEGMLDERQPTRVVLGVGGVGYEVFIPLSSFDKLPPEGAGVRLYIFDHVREDDHVLYGFLTREERRLFVLLLGVSGIGPKLALSVLSGLPPRDLKAAILSGDPGRLGGMRGVGRKTAERIVVELKDKFSAADALEAVAGVPASGPTGLRARDAVLALAALGYKRNEAEDLIRKVAAAPGGADLGVEEMVRKALAT